MDQYTSGNPILNESRQPEETGFRSNPSAAPSSKLFFINLSLRILLLLSSLASTVVMRTGNQTELITNPLTGFVISQQANYSNSPAFIYFVTALSFATSYAATSTLSVVCRRKHVDSNVRMYVISLLDVFAFGIVASATGAAAAVAYIGLKGNEYVGWIKVCNVYGKFCTHIGTSVALALFSSGLLLLIVLLNTYSAHRGSRSGC